MVEREREKERRGRERKLNRRDGQRDGEKPTLDVPVETWLHPNIHMQTSQENNLWN